MPEAMLSRVLVSAAIWLIALSRISALPSVDVTSEIQRGFSVSLKCIRGGVTASQWCRDFQKVVANEMRMCPSGDAFLLGANFGFSFRSESTAEAIGTSDDELRHVAACATNSRVEFEKIKKRLGLTDAELIELLGVDRAKFLAWKARAATTDRDNSVVTSEPGLAL
jgi:hypothetical protein